MLHNSKVMRFSVFILHLLVFTHSRLTLGENARVLERIENDASVKIERAHRKTFHQRKALSLNTENNTTSGGLDPVINYCVRTDHQC